MRKVMVLLAVMFMVVGCSQKESKESIVDNGLNIYMNTDSQCVGTKRIDKKYEMTQPTDLLKNVDYCFIGTLVSTNGTEIYDDGKIKESLNVTVKTKIKGDADDTLMIYRDGGGVSIQDYIDYPAKTCFDKSKLKSLPETLRTQSYLEVVPSTYFKAEMNTDYMFFIKKNGEKLEIYNDSYGMLKVESNEKVKNVYTSEEYKISDISGK